MVSVQLGFEQSGARGMIGSGAIVITLNGVLPFLTSSSGMARLPVTVSGANFRPPAATMTVEQPVRTVVLVVECTIDSRRATVNQQE